MAEGKALDGTCSPTEACQAGPKSAIPLPMRKQKASKRAGVTTPNQASPDREAAPAKAIVSATRPTIRRSNMSAIAAAGAEMRATGSNRAVCANATLSAEAVICVIDQAVPTPMINRPRLDNRLAVQMRRKTAWRNGDRIPEPGPTRATFKVSVISPSLLAEQSETQQPQGIRGSSETFARLTGGAAMATFAPLP